MPLWDGMKHNATFDAVDWSQVPAFEELYDNRKMSETDFDSTDTVNLVMQTPANDFPRIRSIADQHLGWLRRAARDRFTRAFGQYAHRVHNDHPSLPAGATLDPWKRDRSLDKLPPRQKPPKGRANQK